MCVCDCLRALLFCNILKLPTKHHDHSARLRALLFCNILKPTPNKIIGEYKFESFVIL